MSTIPLPLVDVRELGSDYAELLRPGETAVDEHGREHILPRLFMRIDSWEQAMDTSLTEHFKLWELIGVDVRETPLLRAFPRYVPCALLLLAGALELFRQEVGTYVHVAANGGYRSPAHRLSRGASRHSWGTAANIYRIGDTYLEDASDIRKYAEAASRVIPGVWTRPVGSGDGEADDHLHIDIGYTVFEPTQ